MRIREEEIPRHRFDRVRPVGTDIAECRVCVCNNRLTHHYDDGISEADVAGPNINDRLLRPI